MCLNVDSLRYGPARGSDRPLCVLQYKMQSRSSFRFQTTMLNPSFLAACLLHVSLAAAQLTETVGPTTTHAAKRATMCVLSYDVVVVFVTTFPFVAVAS